MPISKFLKWGIDRETIDKLKKIAAGPKGFLTVEQIANCKNPDISNEIKFNVESLDRITEGGINISSVTEIFGESGAGKTQICLHLAINCQLRPEGVGKCIYLACGKSLPVKRLHQIAEELKHRSKSRKTQSINFLDNVFVYNRMEKKQDKNKKEIDNVIKPENFSEIVENLERIWLENIPDVRLLIIDSIADIYRYETDYVQRAIDMRKNMNKIYELSRKYNFAVVCVNQVTADLKNNFSDESISALGPTWQSFVDTKLRVCRTDRYSNGINIREMEVAHSPRLGRNKGDFLITEQGIQSYRNLKRK